MKTQRSRIVATMLGLAAGFGSTGSYAHEFWVEPAAFTIERGGRVGVRLCVGDGFEGWSLARNTQRIEKFVAAGPAGEQPIVGLEGSDPAGVVRFAAPGRYVIAYRSNRAFSEMPAAEFEEYLTDKGLERIAAQRKKLGSIRRRVREAYSRHAKALIRVGNGGGRVIDRPMNLRLELVAEPDLWGSRPDDLRYFRLLHDGKPLARALVIATRPGTTDEDLKGRTDADGRAGFRLHSPGMWRIAAVHMIEPSGKIEADWESLWASLTFELPSPVAGERRSAGNPACRNRVMATTVQLRP